MEKDSAEKEDTFDNVLEDHFKNIKTKIMAEAKSFAEQNKKEVEIIDVTRAMEKYSPGRIFPKEDEEKERKFWRRIGSSISGVTLVTAILAIIFGIVAILDTTRTESWIDIIKLLVGAIVGSSATASLDLKRK